MQNSPGSLSRLHVVGLSWAISSVRELKGGNQGVVADFGDLGRNAAVGRKGKENRHPFSFSENIFVKKNIIGIAR
jgi:hypothetical protein